MVYYEKHELDDSLTLYEKHDLLGQQFDFLQNALKFLELPGEDKETIIKRCDEIVEKRREIVEKIIISLYSLKRI